MAQYMKPDKGKKESKVTVAIKDLSDYIYQLTSNTKRFPKRYNDTFTSRLINLADDALIYSSAADRIYPEPWSLAQADERILNEKKSLAALGTLDMWFGRAYGMKTPSGEKVFGIGEKTLHHFSLMMDETRRLSVSRMKADSERFDEQISEKVKELMNET